MSNEATINVSVSNHYRDASHVSEVTSQGILGERVQVLDAGPHFTQVRQTDGYQSWISSNQLARGESEGPRTAIVRSHFLGLRRHPDDRAEVVRDAVIGSRLPVREERGNWYGLTLPDGLTGWAAKDHFGSFPPAAPENIVALACEFLGYQYLWGGRTPKGFDCSGLVQTTFSLLGIRMPRDSWQQQNRFFKSADLHDTEIGDLLFFGDSRDKVSHVAISLGGPRFIHASGWVKCNSLCRSDPDFDSRLFETFISVNRYPLGSSLT